MCVQSAAVVLVLGSGGLLYVAGRTEGLIGVVLGIASYRLAEARRTDLVLRTRIGALRAHQVMSDAVHVPARSAAPLDDVARMLRAGTGLVGEGPRVLRTRDLRRAPLETCLRGDWKRLSRQVETIDADVRLADLDRFPRRDDLWVVTVGGHPLGVLERARLEQAAAGAAPVPEPDDRRHVT